MENLEATFEFDSLSVKFKISIDYENQEEVASISFKKNDERAVFELKKNKDSEATFYFLLLAPVQLFLVMTWTW